MALNFPSTPTLNEVYTSGDFSWIWNGYAWNIKPQNLPNPTSNTGLYISSDGSNYIFAAAASSSNTIVVDTVTANTSVTIGTSNIVGLASNTFTTSSTSEVSVDSFDKTVYRSAKYFVQMTSGTSYHAIELILTHDDTTVYLAQYGEVYTGSSLGTFNATITSSTLNLLFTATNSTTTVKLVRTSLVV